MYAIVGSGTKLNIDYYIKERIESSIEQDIYDYFLEAESDSLDAAYKEFRMMMRSAKKIFNWSELSSFLIWPIDAYVKKKPDDFFTRLFLLIDITNHLS